MSFRHLSIGLVVAASVIPSACADDSGSGFCHDAKEVLEGAFDPDGGDLSERLGTVTTGNLSDRDAAAWQAAAKSVGGHEILPVGGHVAARWWPIVLPTGGQWFCPR